MTRDPYEVLEIPRTASEEEVKQAYRTLARKYHPDNYIDNPLSDLAEEKIKEINEAYDAIMKERSGGGAAVYQTIRDVMRNGNHAYAEQLLNGCATHDAEWYYLMGCVNQAKGWLDEAQRNFDAAASMNPANAEYAQASRNMRQSGRAYRDPANGYNSGNDCDTCDCCTALICTDCICHCCGGGHPGCC